MLAGENSRTVAQAAAERLGAKVLYSEVLNHGQTYGYVRVENPFLSA